MSEVIERPDMQAINTATDPVGLESPTVGRGFDPGLTDRKPKMLGADTSMPDTRLALRNEARAKAFHANRDVVILEDNGIL